MNRRNFIKGLLVAVPGVSLLQKAVAGVNIREIKNDLNRKDFFFQVFKSGVESIIVSRYVGKYNCFATRKKVEKDVKDYLNTFGEITNCKVVCNETNNTSATISRSELCVDVYFELQGTEYPPRAPETWKSVKVKDYVHFCFVVCCAEKQNLENL